MNRPINYQLSTINRKSKGFTLIELLVVITIISILVAAATASWQNAQEKSRDGKRKADLKALQQALELYVQRNGHYPQSTVNGQIQCNTKDNNVPVDISTKDWGQTFACIPKSTEPAVIYMQQLPKDPAYQQEPTKGYYYSSSPPFFTYTLSLDLENDNDPENINNPNYVVGTILCIPQTGRNYCVQNP